MPPIYLILSIVSLSKSCLFSNKKIQIFISGLREKYFALCPLFISSYCESVKKYQLSPLHSVHCPKSQISVLQCISEIHIGWWQYLEKSSPVDDNKYYQLKRFLATSQLVITLGQGSANYGLGAKSRLLPIFNKYT